MACSQTAQTGILCRLERLEFRFLASTKNQSEQKMSCPPDLRNFCRDRGGCNWSALPLQNYKISVSAAISGLQIECCGRFVIRLLSFHHDGPCGAQQIPSPAGRWFRPPLGEGSLELWTDRNVRLPLAGDRTVPWIPFVKNAAVCDNPDSKNNNADISAIITKMMDW